MTTQIHPDWIYVTVHIVYRVRQTESKTEIRREYSPPGVTPIGPLRGEVVSVPHTISHMFHVFICNPITDESSELYFRFRSKHTVYFQCPPGELLISSPPSAPALTSLTSPGCPKSRQHPQCAPNILRVSSPDIASVDVNHAVPVPQQVPALPGMNFMSLL